MAICSAIRTGLSSIGRMLPRSRILARLVVRARIAAVMLTPTFTHDGVRVVLVDHQPVEADLVGELVLVEIALVVRRGLLAVEEAVRELQAERGVLVALLVGELVVRHLAEVVELHALRLVLRGSRARRRAKASGCSMGGRWPQRSSTVQRRVRQQPAVLLAADRRARCGPRGPRRSASGSSRAAGSAAAADCACTASRSGAPPSPGCASAISSSAGVGGRPKSSSHSGTVFGSWTVSVAELRRRVVEDVEDLARAPA